MSEPTLRLFAGDPYRCERALAEREAALREADSQLERQVHFGDEVQAGALELDLTSMSLFALGRHVVIRRTEKLRQPKTFVPLLGSSFAEGTYLTLIAGDLRATSPIAKAVKARDAFVSLSAPRGNAVRSAAREVLARHGVALDGPATQEFLHRCGNDLMTIDHEAGKLSALPSDGPIDRATIERTVFPSAERTVYPFYDRLGEGNLNAALAELKGLREDPGRMVGGILRHITRLTMVRLLLDRRVPRSEMSPSLGVQDWLLKRLIGQAKRRPLREFTRILHCGIELDRAIKSGRIRPADALTTLVLTACTTMTPRATR